MKHAINTRGNPICIFTLRYKQFEALFLIYCRNSLIFFTITIGMCSEYNRALICLNILNNLKHIT